jgi:hypothetical protein
VRLRFRGYFVTVPKWPKVEVDLGTAALYRGLPLLREPRDSTRHVIVFVEVVIGIDEMNTAVLLHVLIGSVVGFRL